MPEYLAPGVYVEEIGRGARSIEGVATSTAAFLGETERGPILPELVSSVSAYQRLFGGRVRDDKYLPDAVSGFFENGGRRAYVCRITGAGAASATRAVGELDLEAIGPGLWGDRVFVKLTDSTTIRSDGQPYGFRLQVAFWSEPTTGNIYPDPFDPSQATAEAATLVEEFDDLVWDDPDSPDYFMRRLDRRSCVITVSSRQPGALIEQPKGDFAPLVGGADGVAPAVSDYRGSRADNTQRTGLAALELDPYRHVTLVAAPAASEEVVDAIIEHCEQNRFRFAVIDAARGQAAASLDPHARWDTSYAALYYPWIHSLDPESGVQRLVPPCGHVAGIYARTDMNRGVWKAPANEVVLGAVDLEFDVNAQTQEILNPRGVNAIRRFEGRGIRVWGARTLSTNSLWKYVSVRRLFIFLEQSIYEGTQWVVFEPNDETLWQRVKDTIRLFLREQWRSGALMGRTEEQAFAITCDRSTMTQDDILNGRLVCEVAVAPVRPAEFVVFRIYQPTAEAQG